MWTCAGVGTGKYINDKREGVWTYWFDNGKKITEKTFLNGKLIHEETKTVANLVSNFNKTNNSFLFKTPENDKVIVRFDFILQNKDDNTGEVIKVISGNLYSSYRLVPISAIGSDKDESINYIIECTNIDVEFETTQVNSTKNGLYYVYKCNISVTLTLKNSEGETINLKTYSHGSGFLVFTSKQGAFDSANKTDYITKFICKNLPIKTRITTIEDKDSDGAAKTITITGGANIGIYSCEFEVFDEQNKSIGIIKTKDIFSNSTTCKVKTGGDAISLKINQGVKLKVVSIE